MSNKRYNYQSRKPLPHDKEPNIANLKYMTITDKPYTLIGVGIRDLVSTSEYSRMSRECKKRAKGNCEMCGKLVPRGDDFRRHIVCYEAFDYNIEAKTATFHGLLVVCWGCYLRLNPYLISKEIEEHKLNGRDAKSILRKRKTLLHSAGLVSYPLDSKTVFVLEFRGFKYMNDFYPQILDRALSKGVRILRCPFVAPRLPLDYYYRV